MTKETIISVKTDKAVKNIKELKENIEYYKKALESATLGSANYRNTLSLLQESESALKNAMHGVAAQYEDITNAATAANIQFDENYKLVNAETVSYNELVRILAILKQSWRTASTDEAREDLATQINSVNDRLKEMDKTVGVFGRNVGNYIGAVDHLTDGLSKMGSGAAKVVQPIKAADNAAKAFAANPVMAVMGLLANIINAVSKALDSSAENTKALNEAMAPLKAIGDAVNVTLEAMGKALITVVGWFGKLTTAILGNNEAAQARLEIAQEEARLAAQQRDDIKKNAESERDIAELRAKAADRVKYSAAERIEFLEKAGKKEEEMAMREKQRAVDEYNLLLKRMEAKKVKSKEDMDAEAKAYAAMLKAETDYANKSRAINTSLSRARMEEARLAKETAKAAAAAAKAVRDAAQEEAEAFASFMDSMDTEIQAAIEANSAALLEGMENDEKAAADKTKRMLDAVAAGMENRQAWNEVLTEDERELEENRYQIQMEGLARQLEILEEARAAALGEGHLENVLAYEQQIADIKEEVALESAKREKEINKESEKDAENSAKQKQKIMKLWAGNISGLLGGIADAWEAMSDDEEKAAEETKGIRIVTAMIDTISGAISAYMSGVHSGIPSPYNMILGAVQAATTTAMGLANIAKIRSTNVKGGGSGNASVSMPAAVAAPSVQPEVTTTRAITTNSEEERLNQMASPQRVYILDSDLQANEQQRRVQVAETTF